MPKKRKSEDALLRLRYNGEGEQFIVGVPARDLDRMDLTILADQWECGVEQVVDTLTDGSPGRRTRSGKPLYEVSEGWTCEVCGQQFASWDDLFAHEMDEHPATEPDEAEGGDAQEGNET